MICNGPKRTISTSSGLKLLQTVSKLKLLQTVSKLDTRWCAKNRVVEEDLPRIRDIGLNREPRIFCV